MALSLERLFDTGRRFVRPQHEMGTSSLLSEEQKKQAEMFKDLVHGCLTHDRIKHGSLPHDGTSSLHFNRIDLGVSHSFNGETLYYFKEDNLGTDGNFGTDWYIGDRNRVIHKRVPLKETLSLTTGKISGRAVSGEEMHQIGVKIEKIMNIFGGKVGHQ